MVRAKSSVVMEMERRTGPLVNSGVAGIVAVGETGDDSVEKDGEEGKRVDK